MNAGYTVVVVRTCAMPGCNQPLPAGSNAKRKTCSDRCRGRLHELVHKGGGVPAARAAVPTNTTVMDPAAAEQVARQQQVRDVERVQQRGGPPATMETYGVQLAQRLADLDGDAVGWQEMARDAGDIRGGVSTVSARRALIETELRAVELITSQQGTGDISEHPDFGNLLDLIVGALERHPAARTAVLAALRGVTA